MRELAGVGRDAGPQRWLSALAGIIAGLAEAAALVLTVAAAVALSDGAVDLPELPLQLSERSAGTLVMIGFGCAVLRVAASLAGLWLSTAAKTTVEARFQRDLFAAYLGAPWEAMTGITEGRLQELASGQALLAATAVQHLIRAIQYGLSFVMLVAIGVVVDPVSAALSLLGAGALTVLLRPVVRAAAQRTRRRLTHDLDVATITAETVRLGEELSAFGVGDVQAARAGELIDAKRRAGASAEFTSELMPVAYQGAVFVVIFCGLGLLVAVGATVGPQLAAVLLLLLRAFAYSQLAESAYTAACVAAPRREAVLAATGQLAAARSDTGGHPLGPISSFELVHVTYDYPDGPRALDGICLRIEPGEALGISGPSGAGKSTLVQLLLRLRAPTSGALLVDGHPAESFTRASWAAQVALVPQEPKLIDGTIAENIRFLREGISDHQVAEAARLAGLVEELGPERFERRVGPRDRALSGGQRQRVAIARALAGSPSLIVLDEPTSALDLECERIIQETLVSLQGDVTIVVVTHRPTTLQRCDRVVSLRDGRIEAEKPRLPRAARPR